MDAGTGRDIVERLRAGDATVLASVYQAWRPRVYSFLVRLTRQRELAEDLLQETFLRLARHARTLSADTRVDAWLFTVARNLVISHWRTLRQGTSVPLSEEELPCPAAESPFEAAALSQTERRLEHALATLPDSLREAVLLVGLEGFQPSQAADMLGVRPEALRQRLHRARVLLDSQLGREEVP